MAIDGVPTTPEPALPIESSRTTPDLPLRSRIVTKDGLAIADAEISWSLLEPEDTSSARAWLDMDWEELDRKSGHAKSRPDGLFEITLPATSRIDQPSVIWITAPRFRARSIILDGTQRSIPDNISLEQGQGLHATVVDSVGARVPSALVTQLTFQGRADPELGQGRDLSAIRLLRRQSRTDKDGRVELPELPWIQWIWAERDGLRSTVWANTPPGDFTLELRQTFTVSGRVLGPTPDPIDKSPCVSVATTLGSGWRTLSSITVRKDSTWGPIVLPVLEVAEYGFSLEGGGWVAGHHNIPPPLAGEHVMLDFEARAGLALDVHITEEDGLPIEHAEAIIQWEDSGHWAGRAGTTDEHGLAHFRSLGPGSMFVSVSAPHHLRKKLDSFEFTATRTEPITVALGPAATIRGHVLHAGKPISTFYIDWWTNVNADLQDKWFRNSPDGSFEIDEMPATELHVLARSEGLPQSEIHLVRTDLTKAAGVDFLLGDPLIGIGRIVDARSGQPLSDATIQPQMHYLGMGVEAMGALARSDAQGAFRLDGLGAGDNVISVSATGHASREVVRQVKSGDTVDFGAIPLFRTQAIDLQLIGDLGPNPAEFRAELAGTMAVSPTPFGPSGHTRFGDLIPGAYTVRVIPPDGQSWIELHPRLEPEKDLHLEIPVSSRSLAVDIVPAPNYIFPQPINLVVESARPDGRTLSAAYGIFRPGTAHVMRQEGDVTLTMVGNDGVHAVKRVHISPDWNGTLELRVGTGLSILRIIDDAHAPVPDVALTLRLPDDPTHWSQWGLTDSEGLAHLDGCSAEKLFVVMKHSTRGCAAAVLVDLTTAGEQPIDLMLAGREHLTLNVQERGHPLPAFELELRDSKTGVPLGNHSSGDDGRADFGLAGDGKYIVASQQPGYWPSEVELGPGMPSARLEVRRLGSVEFLVKTSLDHALANAEVDLMCDEQKIWVSQWSAAGAIAIAPASLRTDVNGRLRIDGLPNGSFHWRVTSPSGGTREGSVTVPAGACANVGVVEGS